MFSLVLAFCFSLMLVRLSLFSVLHLIGAAVSSLWHCWLADSYDAKLPRHLLRLLFWLLALQGYFIILLSLGFNRICFVTSIFVCQHCLLLYFFH